MSAADLKTSLFVQRQVPEFIADEYPKFITFLEAYYEFLEAQPNTTVTSNNLITKAKTLRSIKDVDDSIEEFEKNFYNTYAALIPLSVQSNKALLFKHLTDIYRSKGGENSFKLLFRLVFGEDIEVILPKNNVLRASASKWQVDNLLRINKDVSSRYIGDGTKKVFYLAKQVGVDEVDIFVDNVLKTPEVDYFINKEYRRLVFYSAPANNAIITARYLNFNANLLNNRKVTGLTSGATAIVEVALQRIISDAFTLGLPIELRLNENSLIGSFLNGEVVSIPVLDETNGVTIDLRASTFSIIRKINVINAGNNHSVGDLVSVIGGNASSNAFGTVASISSGAVDSGLVHHGGAVFTVSSPISVSGNDALSFMSVVVDAIDISGANAANTFTISPDVVSNLSLNVGTVYVNTSNFGSVFGKANISAANSIDDALNFITIQVGPISNISILSTTIPLSEKNQIVLDAAGAEYGIGLQKRFSKSLRSIGRYKINNGGTNYRIGDEIVFDANPLGTYGQHAAAVVGNVAASTGAITRIDSANSRIRGTGSVTAACNEITGTSTIFQQDLFVGDKVDINNESRTVTSIPTDTTVVVDSVFNFSATNRRIGVYNRWPLGGYGYTQNNFPSITVSSSTGSSASVEINSLIGDNERLSVDGFGANGQITSIQVIDPGSGYQYIPTVSVSGGDGTATANAEIERSYVSTPGRWTTSDSIISSFERKIQGEDYYVDYSYVISSQVEFSKYKSMLKQLLHPVGLVNYSLYNKQNIIELNDVAVETVKVNSISGTVNVGNGRALVVGTNTKFNVANTLGILSLGSMIAVNGEMRKINTIVSNTQIITSSNISNLRIANSGSGYSNGYLNFSGGGGQVTSLTIAASGSGYENGSITFSGSDASIEAVAQVEVHASNGALRTLTLTSGGLYSSVPIALPASNPHRVLYANSFTITNPGQGYANGWLIFSGGSPLRDANVQVIVHPNTVINTFIVNDSGLYESNPTATPNTNPNVVIATATITSTGNGHSNGVLTFSGGNPTRAAVVAVETYPPESAQVVSITANTNAHGVNGFIQFTGAGDDNIGANARIYVNSTGGIVNVTVLNRGLYKGTPTATANTGNAVFTLNVLPLDGQVRKLTIVDPGLYSSTPTATPNTTPTSVSFVTSNTAANTFVGRNLANGYLIFSGGNPVRAANATYQVYPANGVINMQSIIVTDAGLYRSPPTSVTPNVVPISVTQVLPLIGGSGYTNGFIVFSTSQGTSNIAANCAVNVNSTGAIVSSVVTNVGLYANGPDVTIVGVLGPGNALQTPTSVASFSIGYNANTLNVANLVVTTAANAGQTAVIGVTANSNSYTNATFTIAGVANSETNAVITVGFTEANTAANIDVEVYSGNGAIRSVRPNLVWSNTFSVSTYSLVYTASFAYSGGVLDTNGDIHFIPRQGNRGQKVSSITGVVSTYSLVYTETEAYRGGVLAQNGDVHFVPQNANRGQKISAAGVVSTYSLVYTTVSGAYAGGVLDTNGDIHFIPQSADRGQKISSAGVVSTYSLVYTTGTAYFGGVLAQNGDVHFVPASARVGQKISSAGVVSTYSLIFTGASGAYQGGVLAQNGDIHFVPYTASRGQKISAAGVVSTYSLIVASLYTGGVLAKNGDIHFIPRLTGRGQKISAAGVVSTYSLVYTTSSHYDGGVINSLGTEIYFVPSSAAVGQKVFTNDIEPKPFGEYYYTPSATPNSAGSGAVFTYDPVSWYQTANAQSAIIIK
jgi:hypothetical protein